MGRMRILLKDTKTGKLKEIFDSSGTEEEMKFSWEEGNLSCDCNRYRYFYEDYHELIPCGENRFKTLAFKYEEQTDPQD